MTRSTTAELESGLCRSLYAPPPDEQKHGRLNWGLALD